MLSRDAVYSSFFMAGLPVGFSLALNAMACSFSRCFSAAAGVGLCVTSTQTAASPSAANAIMLAHAMPHTLMLTLPTWETQYPLDVVWQPARRHPEHGRLCEPKLQHEAEALGAEPPEGRDGGRKGGLVAAHGAICRDRVSKWLHQVDFSADSVPIFWNSAIALLCCLSSFAHFEKLSWGDVFPSSRFKCTISFLSFCAFCAAPEVGVGSLL
jgi:hypothetical protein